MPTGRIIVLHERETCVYCQSDQSGTTAGNVDADPVDISICQEILGGHDFLYFAGNGINGGVPAFQPGFRDLVDIITGHQAGKVVQTFCVMIGLGIGNTVLAKVSDYASSYLGMKVDAEIKSDIFAKILVTDWESLTNYHTGDLLTRWGSDASNISGGVLSFVPNMVIFLFRFISAFAMVIYYDPSFAIFAF